MWSGWLLLRQETTRRGLMDALARLPAAREMMTYYRTALFCRNLGLLLRSGVNLTTTLRILVLNAQLNSRMRHAIALSESKQLEAAADTLRAAVELGQDTPKFLEPVLDLQVEIESRILVKQAMALRRAGKLAEARALYERVLAKSTDVSLRSFVEDHLRELDAAATATRK